MGLEIMLDSFAPALRVLGYFWLEEVRPDDAGTIALLPDLAGTLPNYEPDTLDQLAVEYQRLFGFNLPPYESVFIDPSVMLMAPATQLVQQLYQAGGWVPPTDTRAGAPDHLGIELLALADWLDAGRTDLAEQLHLFHLAVWVPPFMLALTSLRPHP
ncbi:MAG: molecular chaperone TorD family protein, partial [Anaerolineae bacterium]|nr:molecular chaperone TorD family protein [Anaerolineae bacterium]